MLQLTSRVAIAGSWFRYARAPRVELVTLRTLCARGRATPAPSAMTFERLFGVPSSSTGPAPSALPDEVFWIVLSFWRTSRDDELDDVLRDLDAAANDDDAADTDDDDTSGDDPDDA